jgi:selenocysteine lyase/cysteine desulfurase
MNLRFDKSADRFPVKHDCVYLAHCGVSPLASNACAKAVEVCKAQMTGGYRMFADLPDILEELRDAAASLLSTSRDNLAMVKNTSEAMNMIAQGYPFEPGDRIVSYVHEYPAVHYPWRLLRDRGVELDLLPDRDIGPAEAGGRPCGWSMRDLERTVTERTRMVALSHVQFTSGFAADLERLGAFCAERGLELVVDAAQSLGCMPIDPHACRISALASSGWKWLLGPIGSGLFYTAPDFREKLRHFMGGAEAMRQGKDYLDHSWNPHESAKRFEYSTSPLSVAAALSASIRDNHLVYGTRAIFSEVRRLQDRLLQGLDRERYAPLEFPPENRSGIVSLMCPEEPQELQERVLRRGVATTARGGYLRIAAHFYNTEQEIDLALEALHSPDL